MSSQQLSGKTAIITGASAGIGEAIAIMMAERGASVVICGQNEVRLQAALEKCVQASGGHSERFVTVAADVTTSSGRKDILEKAVQTFGKLDILVNNAGIFLPEAGILTITEECWDRSMDTNLKQAFFLTQAAVPLLEKTKGNVINISSIWSTNAVPVYILAPVSKAGLDHMTRCLALDLGSRGIRVNSVSPSFILGTEVLRHFPAEKAQAVPAYWSSVKHQIQPMGELGTKDQVAETVLFLASEAASFVTGQHMFATGGNHLVNMMPPSSKKSE